ncbi:hypothetical protein [Paenibacillus glucanolyticus]|uniref:hypothetical protein n=1 Tax=Paenibacillus glucanolyticus TaxID=59843 RepID=UPI00128C053F|nr:hypothetical protein [Paenibacillus glucanolyticus]MPY20682.1 hypothetical protein [Paenibacillus glucanolyticus]
MKDVAAEREWLEYCIRCNESYIREYEKLIASAERQIEEERQARGKAAMVARDRIEHLTKSFIPWQQEGLKNAQESLERYRSRLDNLSFVENDGQLELVF